MYKLFQHIIDSRRKFATLLLGFFLLQCIGILDPPLEMGHNWRQSLTAMVCRNYYENGMDWLYPRIDVAGDRSGIVGCEFPIYNFFVFLAYKIFGFHHGAGRIVNLIAVCWGMYHFHAIVKAWFGPSEALLATIILMCSSWFTFSRKIMPDTFSISLVLVGIHWMYKYLMSGNLKWILGGALMIGLGVLSKIPSMCLLACGTVLFVSPHIKTERKIFAFLMVAMALLPSIWWYFIWVPFLNHTYHFQWFFPKGLMQGFYEILPLWRLLLEKFYFTSFYSFLAFFTFLFGIGVLLKQRNQKEIKIGLLSIAAVFGLFILKTGSVFPLHTYYNLPFLPAMSVLAALGLQKIKSVLVKKSWLFSLLLLGLVAEALANQIHDHFIKDSETYKLTLEKSISILIPKGDRVIINSGVNPQEMYLLNRKGWVVFNSEINTDGELEILIGKGAKYLVINHGLWGQSYERFNRFQEVFRSEKYVVYRL